ncbi:MAG: DUF6624 domain-containing protein [Bacteroidota bacterium]
MSKILSTAVAVFLIFTAYSQQQNSTKIVMDSITANLERLFMEDQLFRQLYLDAERKFGKDSEEMEYFWQVVEEQDHRIENELIKILDQYGWLGISDVGRRGNTAIWAIIQHSPVELKQKYAPLMKASILKKESQPRHYARLIDRMLINQGQPQIYGTQTTRDEGGNLVFYEIDAPEKVNERRRAIGLSVTIGAFAKQNGIEWNIE